MKWSLHTFLIMNIGDQFNNMDQPSLNDSHEENEDSARGFSAKVIFMINLILNSFS